MRRALCVLGALSLLWGCEDGPEQIYEPDNPNPTVRNGYEGGSFVQPGDVPLEIVECNAAELGETRFCCEQEHEQVVQSMVVKPIIPGEGLGGVKVWSPDGPPTHADDLLGRPEDGKFCDPTIYSNALTWGPTNEIIAFINEETRLIENLVATEQYIGTLEGTYQGYDPVTGAAGEYAVRIVLRERLRIGDHEFDQFAASAEQENTPNSWLNHKVVTELYRFIRQSYFGDSPDKFAEDFSCVDSNACNIIYTSQNSGPQDTVVYLVDSGFILVFTPDGHIANVYVEPVRVAPFENAMVRMGTPGEAGGMGTLAPTVASDACTLDLSAGMTWGQVKSMCIGENADEALKRFTYDVSGQRDAVTVDFNGISLSFLHDTVAKGLLLDGEQPADDDVLFGIDVTRQLSAPVAEFNPQQLANAFKTKIEQRIHEAVRQPAVGGGELPDGGAPEADMGAPEADMGAPEADMGAPEADMGAPEADMGAPEADMGAAPDLDMGVEPPPADAAVQPGAQHPFLTWTLDVPEFADESMPLDRLQFVYRGVNSNWLEIVAQQINEAYWALPADQRAMVDPLVTEPTWVVEAFVEAVMEAFTHGRTGQEHAFIGFQNTDDKNWVIGFVHVVQDGVPYRIVAQYSLSYGAVTALSMATAFSPIDDIFNGWNQKQRPRPGLGTKSPYYGVDLARQDPEQNALALGGDGIRVIDSSRALSTVTVDVADADRNLVRMEVPGLPPDDRGGYLRQIRGERWEWVRATSVQLNGKETAQLYYVDEEDGRIGRIVEGRFKSPVQLCPGLNIEYGDRVADKLAAWADTAGLRAYRQCEVVFNYSANGNVLDGVVSLTTRVAFTISNGRAVSVAVWR